MDSLLNECYTKGNECFKLREYDRAIELYSSALHLQLSPTSPVQLDSQLLLRCRLNRSQCFLKTDSYCEAVEDCTYIISYVDDTSCDSGPSFLHEYLMKSLMRRAQAHECLGNYSKALVDVDRVLTMDLSVNLTKTMIVLRSRLRSSLAVDRSLSVAAGRPFAMVTDQQALRLTFLHQLPRKLALNRPYYVRLSVTNELGLWNRDLCSNSYVEGHSDSTGIYVECVLHPVAASNACISEEAPSYRVLLQSHHGSSRDVGGGIELGTNGKADLAVVIECASHSCGIELSDLVFLLEFRLSKRLPSNHDVSAVLSLPFSVFIQDDSTAVAASEQKGVAMQLQRACDQCHAACIRRVDVAVGGYTRPAYALESPGFFGIAGKVWDSMYVLLRFLSVPENRMLYVAHKRIIELGSGTGLAGESDTLDESITMTHSMSPLQFYGVTTFNRYVGIGLSSMSPAAVVLTDMGHVVPLLEANILLNCALSHDREVRITLAERFTVEPYEWGAQSPQWKTVDAGRFDVILASDVVYDPVGYEPLVLTLTDLLTAANGEYQSVCILAHRHRHPEDERFFRLLREVQGAIVEEIDFSINSIQDCSTDRPQSEELLDVKLFKIRIVLP